VHRIRRSATLVVAVLTLAGAGLATIAMSAPPAGAVSTFTVTSAADSGNGSLRKAIDDATNADADSVIDVNAGLAITLTGFAPVYAPASGDKTLTINGNGASVTRTAGTSEIFRFNTTGDVTINALDITNLPNPSPANGGAGGAIYAQGSLFVRSSTIHGTIDATGNLGYRGGAIYAANVTLVDSNVTGSTTSTTVMNNTYGGAIYANSDFHATNSTVDGSIEANSTFGSGGGVYTQGGLVLDGSHVTGAITSTYTTSDGNWFGGAV
jgi:predicted outer membrane repeat protein